MVKSEHRDDPMSSLQSRKKFLELDLLRVLAIALVISSHATAYLGWSPHINQLMKFPGSIGVGLFLYLSGFLCQRSQNNNQSNQTRWEVLQKRLVRIFPLYWLSLLAFIVIFHFLSIFHNFDFSPLPTTVIAHFLGLHLVLRSSYVSRSPTLWYIGGLVIYYLLFSLMSKLNFKKFLALNILLFVSAILLKIFFKNQSIHIIDNRLIMNYPIFLTGVIVGKFDPNFLFLRRYIRLTLFLSLTASLLFRIFYGQNLIGTHTFLIDWQDIKFYLYIFVWTIFFLNLGILVTPLMLKASKKIEYFATISYAIYLFHRPIYGLIYGLLLSLDLGSKTIRTIMFPLATLLLIIASQYITSFDINVLQPKATQVMRKLFPKTATK
ncbi:MAG: acyltransferase [Limnospira sp. PMC 1291.21]|uniref:acyltransferase family protein n=1 Tax=Limnospira TaxID=2596745 RepID=UPI0014499609|nr:MULTISPECIES: acyltransferase [unclassified Limnospira]QJB29071.1 acyltransferase [Limnospira fusiformis SAG 85.79]MDT9180598.1 acyltransferase [Limnospira sp. PMC 1238.20]MDT9195919.1 acyltransferase [Limnospira sp. PMC 1245.20]MDT9206167.1 acyltransferase [Limnospira sp. PMC 1243.20]MDT9211315.1 acyltransferase [Limnospira sp. PMC 1252.20]